jgi:hypothetical protein
MITYKFLGLKDDSYTKEGKAVWSCKLVYEIFDTAAELDFTEQGQYNIRSGGSDRGGAFPRFFEALDSGKLKRGDYIFFIARPNAFPRKGGGFVHDILDVVKG